MRVRGHRGRAVIVGLALLGGCVAAPATAPESSTTGRPGPPPATSAGLNGDQAKDLATTLLGDLETGSRSTTLARFDPTMRAALDDATLKEAWDKTVAPLGAYRRVVGATATTKSGLQVVTALSEHDKAYLKALFSFDATGQIAGLWFDVAAPSDLAGLGVATTATATGTHGVDTAVEVGPHRLGGTLVLPNGTRKPIVVLFLTGSGPQDRDETIGAARNKPFRDLADGLAARGIASLRVDDRTYAAPESLGAHYTLDDEYFADAAAAVALLRARPELAGYRVFVLGHSLGGVVMPKVVADNRLAGGISWAGTPRSLWDLVADQTVAAIESATGKTAAEKQAMTAKARAWTTSTKAMTDPNAASVDGLAASYIVSVNKLDQAKTAAALTVPLLFQQGGADFQVSPTTDFGRWQTLLAGRSNVTFKLYAGLNHLFTPTTGLRTVADYDKPAHVSDAVIADLAGWLERVSD